MKESVTVEELTKGLDPEFKEMLDYIRELDFMAKPDYKKLKIMLSTIV